jgi:hypothetical protein
MSIPVERIEELLELAQEVDLPTLRTLNRKLHLLLEQREASQLQTGPSMSTSEEFHQRYPHISIDPDLFSLVGIHPENPLGEDKILIREQIARRLTK